MADEERPEPRIVRSTVHASDVNPVPTGSDREYEDYDGDDYRPDEWERRWLERDQLMEDALAHEGTLPGRRYSWEWESFDDEYVDAWYAVDDHDIDDSPAWHAEAFVACGRCGRLDDLDPLGTCRSCRYKDRRCRWCGLDPWVYEIDEACRTCYQRLRRNRRVTNEEELHLSMLGAAFRRSDLRKRRNTTS